MRFFCKRTDGAITTFTILESANLATLNTYLAAKYPPSYFTVTKAKDTGTATFAGQQTMNISFSSAFSSVPVVLLSLGANEGSQIFKTNVTTTGFTINFATNYTGTVTWEATEA
jgi:hypothetical protein